VYLFKKKKRYERKKKGAKRNFSREKKRIPQNCGKKRNDKRVLAADAVGKGKERKKAERLPFDVIEKEERGKRWRGGSGLLRSQMRGRKKRNRRDGLKGRGKGVVRACSQPMEERRDKLIQRGKGCRHEKKKKGGTHLTGT